MSTWRKRHSRVCIGPGVGAGTCHVVIPEARPGQLRLGSGWADQAPEVAGSSPAAPTGLPIHHGFHTDEPPRMRGLSDCLLVSYLHIMRPSGIPVTGPRP